MECLCVELTESGGGELTVSATVGDRHTPWGIPLTYSCERRTTHLVTRCGYGRATRCVCGGGGVCVGEATPLATLDTQRGLARGVVAHRPVMQMAVLRRDGEPEVVHKPHRGLRPARHTSRRRRSAQPHCSTPLTRTTRCMVPTASYTP